MNPSTTIPGAGSSLIPSSQPQAGTSTSARMHSTPSANASVISSPATALRSGVQEAMPNQLQLEAFTFQLSALLSSNPTTRQLDLSNLNSLSLTWRQQSTAATLAGGHVSAHATGATAVIRQGNQHTIVDENTGRAVERLLGTAAACNNAQVPAQSSTFDFLSWLTASPFPTVTTPSHGTPFFHLSLQRYRALLQSMGVPASARMCGALAVGAFLGFHVSWPMLRAVAAGRLMQQHGSQLTQAQAEQIVDRNGVDIDDIAALLSGIYSMNNAHRHIFVNDPRYNSLEQMQAHLAGMNPGRIVFNHTFVDGNRIGAHQSAVRIDAAGQWIDLDSLLDAQRPIGGFDAMVRHLHTLLVNGGQNGQIDMLYLPNDDTQLPQELVWGRNERMVEAVLETQYLAQTTRCRFDNQTLQRIPPADLHRILASVAVRAHILLDRVDLELINRAPESMTAGEGPLLAQLLFRHFRNGELPLTRHELSLLPDDVAAAVKAGEGEGGDAGATQTIEIDSSAFQALLDGSQANPLAIPDTGEEAAGTSSGSAIPGVQSLANTGQVMQQNAALPDATEHCLQQFRHRLHQAMLDDSQGQNHGSNAQLTDVETTLLEQTMGNIRNAIRMTMATASLPGMPQFNDDMRAWSDADFAALQSLADLQEAADNNSQGVAASVQTYIAFLQTGGTVAPGTVTARPQAALTPENEAEINRYATALEGAMLAFDHGGNLPPNERLISARRGTLEKSIWTVRYLVRTALALGALSTPPRNQNIADWRNDADQLQFVDEVMGFIAQHRGQMLPAMNRYIRFLINPRDVQAPPTIQGARRNHSSRDDYVRRQQLRAHEQAHPLPGLIGRHLQHYRGRLEQATIGDVQEPGQQGYVVLSPEQQDDLDNVIAAIRMAVHRTLQITASFGFSLSTDVQDWNEADHAVLQSTADLLESNTDVYGRLVVQGVQSYIAFLQTNQISESLPTALHLASNLSVENEAQINRYRNALQQAMLKLAHGPNQPGGVVLTSVQERTITGYISIVRRLVRTVLALGRLETPPRSQNISDWPNNPDQIAFVRRVAEVQSALLPSYRSQTARYIRFLLDNNDVRLQHQSRNADLRQHQTVIDFRSSTSGRSRQPPSTRQATRTGLQETTLRRQGQNRDNQSTGNAGDSTSRSSSSTAAQLVMRGTRPTALHTVTLNRGAQTTVFQNNQSVIDFSAPVMLSGQSTASPPAALIPTSGVISSIQSTTQPGRNGPPSSTTAGRTAQVSQEASARGTRRTHVENGLSNTNRRSIDQYRTHLSNALLASQYNGNVPMGAVLDNASQETLDASIRAIEQSVIALTHLIATSPNNSGQPALNTEISNWGAAEYRALTVVTDVVHVLRLDPLRPNNPADYVRAYTHYLRTGRVDLPGLQTQSTPIWRSAPDQQELVIYSNALQQALRQSSNLDPDAVLSRSQQKRVTTIVSDARVSLPVIRDLASILHIRLNQDVHTWRTDRVDQAALRTLVTIIRGVATRLHIAGTTSSSRMLNVDRFVRYLETGRAEISVRRN